MTKIWKPYTYILGLWPLLVGPHPAWSIGRPASSIVYWPFIGTLDSPALTLPQCNCLILALLGQECQGARQPLSLALCSRLKGSQSPCLGLAYSPSLSSQTSTDRRTLLIASLFCLMGQVGKSWGRWRQGVLLRGPLRYLSGY